MRRAQRPNSEPRDAVTVVAGVHTPKTPWCDRVSRDATCKTVGCRHAALSPRMGVVYVEGYCCSRCRDGYANVAGSDGGEFKGHGALCAAGLRNPATRDAWRAHQAERKREKDAATNAAAKIRGTAANRNGSPTLDDDRVAVRGCLFF